jgi:hypothetical protein
MMKEYLFFLFYSMGISKIHMRASTSSSELSVPQELFDLDGFVPEV